MKTQWIKVSALAIMLAGTALHAQENDLREYLAPEKYNRNIFEAPKVTDPAYEGVKVTVGGDFTAQFQGLDQSTSNTNLGTISATNKSPNYLLPLRKDLNLPGANLDVNAYLSTGLKLHLTAYLSSRHHEETWVKGGYIQVDNLSFIAPGFLDNVMQHARLKVGMDDLNYGDAHFRRTDGAFALNNPYVGNNIMDAHTTQPFVEVYGFFNGFTAMAGFANGQMNQYVVNTNNNGSNTASEPVDIDIKPAVYAKIAYDKQVDSDLRIRLSGSVFHTSGLNSNGQLYGDDRTGSRYFYTLLTAADKAKIDATPGGNWNESNPATGRFNPAFKNMTSFMINPFIKYQGLEFFGTIERASGYKTTTAAGVANKVATSGAYTQFEGDLLYRFGDREQFYLGTRYNNVHGKDYDGADTRDIERFTANAGWFLTRNVLTKVEYVNQKYNESAAWGATSPLNGGKFHGVMVEATIGF